MHIKYLYHKQSAPRTPHYLTVQTQSMIPTTTTTTISLHPFNCLFSRTTWKSRYQKGEKTSLDLNEAKDNGGLGMQWHQLDHMQTICILLHTEPHHTGRMIFLTPNQQCQSTLGIIVHNNH